MQLTAHPKNRFRRERSPVAINLICSRLPYVPACERKMVSHTQPPLPKHSRFHLYGTRHQGFRVGSTCTYRPVIDSALRGNQNEREITVKVLANDSRESHLERSRKMRFLSCQGGHSEQTVLEMLESFCVTRRYPHVLL